MAFSAWPGSVTEPISEMFCLASSAARVLPPLPDEITTTTPEATSSFTAWHSGDWPAA